MKYLFKCAILTLLTPLVATEEGLDNTWTASRFTPLNDTRVEMKRISRNTRVDSPTLLPPPYLQLPVFQHSRLPLVEKEHFSPTHGTGYEQLPVEVGEVLFPVSPTTKPSTSSIQSRGVMTWCNVTKMTVLVQRSILGADASTFHLKFGACHATKSTKKLFFFEYDLGLCGNKRTMINNRVAYSNTLRYDPPRLTGPIRRAVPFTLPITCHYNRYHYSYKIGYIPKLQMRKVFKPMRHKVKFILTPHNAQWERLSPSDSYMIGEPMYFQAEGTSEGPSTDGRLYVHSCHATLKRSHASVPRFPVVENFGCMVESKTSHSRFILYKKDIVRFSVDAFLFKGMTGQQLYLHCAMSVGGSLPTPTAKSCNYDTKAGRWQELYNSTSVCSCCDSKCSSAALPVTKMVSSIPWSVEYIDPSTTPKRTVKPKMSPKGVIFKPVAITVMTNPTTKSRTMMTKTRKTPQPKEKGKGIAKTDVEEVVRELEWPFGGRDVMWTEEGGDEKLVKGFAVVEEERISGPRIIPCSATVTPKRAVKPSGTPKGMIFKPVTTQRRMSVTTTPVATTKTMTAMTKTRKTQRPKEKGMVEIDVEEVQGGLEWPFGGVGVTWTKEERVKSTNGFAVVEEEKLPELRTIPWSVDYTEPIITPKRTVVSKITTKGMIFKPRTHQPKEKGMAKTHVEEVLRGSEWPFGGRGVTSKTTTMKPKTTPKGMIFKPVTTQRRMRVTTPVEGNGKSTKGLVVVEEEQVYEPRTIFEDVFGLDK